MHSSNSARVGGKGIKNYRIAETRTRRVEREERFDDTDVMQRASQIVMYVKCASEHVKCSVSVSHAIFIKQYKHLLQKKLQMTAVFNLEIWK